MTIVLSVVRQIGGGFAHCIVGVSLGSLTKRYVGHSCRACKAGGAGGGGQKKDERIPQKTCRSDVMRLASRVSRSNA